MTTERIKLQIHTGVVCCLTKAALFIAAPLLVAACVDVSNTAAEPFDADKAAQVWNTADKMWNADELGLLESGKSLYRGRCSACHQYTGAGSATIGAPALKGSALARGSADTLIGTVLFGRGTMPAFRTSLDDAELALILSYVRNAWGNDMQELLQAPQVAVIRSAGRP